TGSSSTPKMRGTPCNGCGLGVFQGRLIRLEVASSAVYSSSWCGSFSFDLSVQLVFYIQFANFFIECAFLLGGSHALSVAAARYA
ncbi:hypothetical protein, partial [Xanthomonas nasturtii]